MIIVGSQALKHFGLNRSEPKDMDAWGVCPYVTGLDYHQVSQELLDLLPNEDGCATPDAIYTIKCSHLAWDIKWEKTKNDILWLQAKGCTLLPKLYTALKKHWEKEHGDKSFLSLKKEKDYFFGDFVKYNYDHDYLHELVAWPNQPMYNCCLKEGEQVLIDKKKFDSMSFDNQVRMFREEITVIAIERWLVHNKRMTWFEAYGLSLKKTITNLTKNWACDFIIQHLKHFTKPEYSYFSHALITLNLEEDIMSKVDMKVFEELAEELGMDGVDSELVYSLACEEFDGIEMEGVGWRDVGDLIDAAIERYDYKHLQQEGGGEGGSEYCYGIFSLKGKVYKAEYQYYSHNGHKTDEIIDSLQEVKAVEKTVTVYE